MVVIVKLPALPTVKVALATLAMIGGWSTVSVKVWVADDTPLAALMVKECRRPASADEGVPLRAAVPLWLSTKATPSGKLPLSVSAAAG